MKVAGFSFVRNAIQYDYPILEAIRSILPVCDVFVVAVGNSEDKTLELIQSLHSQKVQIIETIWDDSLREGGKVLALETDKAFQTIGQEYDWAFYIQGDEVIHEKYLDLIQAEMLKWKDKPYVEGLLFKYKHFYGSYNYVGDSRQWYRNEVRIIRNDKNIYSYRDAQGFRKKPNQKLKVKAIDAYVYHYGWVREPYVQMQKQKAFHRFWSLREYETELDKFDYQQIDSLTLFDGLHPAVMQKRIEEMSWEFNHNIREKNYNQRVKWLMWFEKMTGYRIGEYKNYRLV